MDDLKEPENLRAWFGLAAVYKDTQCYVQAITCWEKILEILDARALNLRQFMIVLKEVS